MHQVRTWVAPGTWDTDARRALYVEKDEIVARHAPEVLDRVERLIETLKANRDLMVRLRARLLQIPAGELAAIPHLPPSRDGLGGVFDLRDLEEWIAGRPPDRRIEVTTVPLMTLFHWARGAIQIGSRIPYLRGCEAKGEGYDPLIDEISTGLEIRLQAVANGPGSDRLLLEISVSSRELQSVTALKLGDYVVQLPVTGDGGGGGRFVLGRAQALLLLPRPGKTSGRVTAILVEAEGVPAK